MSGVEVLGIISAVISIVDATIKVYNAAKNEAGLPPNFKTVATKLPLISRLLEDAERYVDEEVDDALTSPFTPVLTDFKEKATQLQQLFEKVIPTEGDSRIERYFKAARTVGKGGRVETLMKGILDNLQLLTAKFPMVVSQRGQANLTKAIEEVSELEPSLPDGFEDAPTFAHFGSGAQNVNTGVGSQYNNNSTGNQNNGPGNQYIGTNHIGSSIYAPNASFLVDVPTERPETPPNPSILIPFSRNGDFVKREVINQIQHSCGRPGSRTALVGFGGVGKSQLAIEYAYQIRERSSNTWVFWIHASDGGRFEEGFRDIAKCVKVPGRQNPKVNIFQLVHDWLRDERKGPWVIILDDVDDPSFLKLPDPDIEAAAATITSARPRQLISYIPYCQHGSVLVTSGSRAAALELVEHADIIEIEPMNESDALQLFQNKLSPSDSKAYTIEIARAVMSIRSKAMVAEAYSRNQAKWAAERAIEVHVLETSKKKLWDFHPDTLTGMANLASTYRNQGRWEAAEVLFVQVLETRKKKLGDDHPSTLTSMANLASTYGNQGRWEAAEELFVQVLETSKKKLGDDHPDTLNCMNNLAWTYWNSGRLEKAKALMKHCIPLLRAKLGDSHPNYLSATETLAEYEAGPDDSDANSEASDTNEVHSKNLGEGKDSILSPLASTTLRQELRSWLRVDEKSVDKAQGAKGNSNEQSEEVKEAETTENMPAREYSIKGIGNEESDKGNNDKTHTTTQVSITDTSTNFPITAFLGMVVFWASGRWVRLRASISPPAEGYERLFYTCSCGDTTYFDVRETSPGGIEGIKQRLRASQLGVGDDRRHQDTALETTPRVPPKAHTRSSRTQLDVGEPQSVTPAAAAGRPSSPEAQEGGRTTAMTALDQNSVPQFLLVCVNAKELAVLVQVEVGSLTSDGFLFREIRNAYRKATEDYAWKLCMFFPQRLRNAISDPPQFLSQIYQMFASIRLHRIASGDFVGFQLVPVGETAHPMWFRSPEFPPEREVVEHRYLYGPVPIGVDIVNIPLSHLLKPGEHHDVFWLSLLPKKLNEELRRPAGTKQPIVGWGIRVNEKLNWAVALLGLFFLLIMISVAVIVYSVATRDNSSAFGLGAYLAALLTVYLTYKYFAWKEDM